MTDRVAGWDGMHVGRSFTGHPLEDDCPCEKAPCGLAVWGHNPDCPQHGPGAMKTIRQAHKAEDCPDASSNRVPAHLVQRACDVRPRHANVVALPDVEEILHAIPKSAAELEAEWERGMTCPDCGQYGDGCNCGSTRNSAAVRRALEVAVDEAWARYKDWREEENSSATYREGFADGLERALLIFDRHNGEPDA